MQPTEQGVPAARALLAPAVDAFCESKFGGMFRPGTEGGVEVGNTLTALMVGYVAVHMLVWWDVDLFLIKFIAGLFVTNCIGSIGYHSIRDANLGRMDFDSRDVLPAGARESAPSRWKPESAKVLCVDKPIAPRWPLDRTPRISADIGAQLLSSSSGMNRKRAGSEMPARI